MTSVDAPAWSLITGAGTDPLPLRWPHRVTREWAWDGSTGSGIRVCVVDSGIERDHPRVGRVDEAVVVRVDDDGSARIEPDDAGDVAGHGTACAGIARALAPGCALHSVRVLGAEATGTAAAFLAGLGWAVEQGFDVVNLSMSTRKREILESLRAITDDAYFRNTVIVSSAHNRAVASFPWRFSSVLSVGAHDAPDPFEFHYNPRPPVEFFARGTEVEVAWCGGATITATGNSFATAHLSGICALVLAKHPGLTPFELKSVLYQTATNVAAGAG